MNITSPKAVASLTATIAAVISLVAMLIASDFDSNNILFILGAMAVVFAIIMVTVHYLLSKLIFEKINPIYKTIQSLNIPDSQLRKSLEDKDQIEEVNREVLLWANRKSEELDKLKAHEGYRKEFLGNVSHELKTPIFNIQGYVLTLLDGALSDPSINRKYLERTEKSINRLISIVEDLEAISKLESGELKLKMEKINIVALVSEAFESQEFRARQKGIKLVFGSDSSEPVWVEADKKRVFQVLVNLIVNSVNYGKEGGRTRVSFMDMDESILVEVNDNGIGIPKEHIPRVFERFYRVDKSRSREQGGSGLGLAIVKHIIEAHNQTINVRSNLNEGTSFVFTLAKYRK